MVAKFLLIAFAFLWTFHICFNNLRGERHQQLRSAVFFLFGPEGLGKYDDYYRNYSDVTRLLNTHLRWWMYGKQSRQNTEFRIVGKYGNQSEVVYRDLYIPYSMREFHSLFRSSSNRVFWPPSGSREMSILHTHASTQVPRTPLPPLSLHPHVPFPKFDSKVEKYHDNIHMDKDAMKSYLAYFASSYPSYLELPLISATLYRYSQNFLDISKARETGILLDDKFMIVPFVELELHPPVVSPYSSSTQSRTQQVEDPNNSKGEYKP